MSQGLLLLIVVHSIEVLVIGGLAIYCFVFEKADFMDLWYIWGPVLVATATGSLLIQRLFPNNKR